MKVIILQFQFIYFRTSINKNTNYLTNIATTMGKNSSTRVLTVLFVLIMSTICMFIGFQEHKETSNRFPAVLEYHNERYRDKYFKALPGTNWTIFDIRRGEPRPESKEIIGVDNVLGSGDWKNIPQIIPSDTNRSSESHILIYNRVPKCASITLIALMKLLGARHGFDVITSATFWR